MQNEVRYYLEILKKSMTPLSAEERADALLSFNLEPEARMEPRVVFVPTHIITVVKLPGGSKEIAINTDDIAGKIDYILEAYDENMCLKARTDIVMLNLLIV